MMLYGKYDGFSPFPANKENGTDRGAAPYHNHGNRVKNVHYHWKSATRDMHAKYQNPRSNGLKFISHI